MSPPIFIKNNLAKSKPNNTPAKGLASTNLYDIYV